MSLIHHRGRDIPIPMGKTGEAGAVTAQVKNWVGDIMYGRVSHPWGVVVPEEQ